MDTPNLDKEINWLSALDRNNELSDNGKKNLEEFRKIKEVISKVNNVVLDDVSKCYSEKDMDKAYDRGFKDGNQRDLTGSIIEML